MGVAGMLWVPLAAADVCVQTGTTHAACGAFAICAALNICWSWAEARGAIKRSEVETSREQTGVT